MKREIDNSETANRKRERALSLLVSDIEQGRLTPAGDIPIEEYTDALLETCLFYPEEFPQCVDKQLSRFGVLMKRVVPLVEPAEWVSVELEPYEYYHDGLLVANGRVGFDMAERVFAIWPLNTNYTWKQKVDDGKEE